jgi:hypothetical protein
MSTTLNEMMKEYLNDNLETQTSKNSNISDKQIQEKKNIMSPRKYNTIKTIDKTYLKYNSPQKTKNNEEISMLTPKNNSFMLNDKSQKIKNEIYQIKKILGYKEPIIANISNINKPNEFYSNSIKIEEEKNNNNNLYNRPIINLYFKNYDLEPEKIYNYSLTDRILIEPGIFKATNKLKRKKEDNIKERDYKGFDSLIKKNKNEEIMKRLNGKGRDEFISYMNEMNRLKNRK